MSDAINFVLKKKLQEQSSNYDKSKHLLVAQKGENLHNIN